MIIRTIEGAATGGVGVISQHSSGFSLLLPEYTCACYSQATVTPLIIRMGVRDAFSDTG